LHVVHEKLQEEEEGKEKEIDEACRGFLLKKKKERREEIINI
jgi:hypothetical protein